MLTDARPGDGHEIAGWDASGQRVVGEKADVLRTGNVQTVSQAGQLENPDSVVVIGDLQSGPLLSDYAACYQGLSSADSARFSKQFWEFGCTRAGWTFLQGTVDQTAHYGGRDHVLWLDQLLGVASDLGAAIRGRQAWGRQGIVFGQMRALPSSLYTGEVFCDSAPVLIPVDPSILPAVWAFCESGEMARAIRANNPKLSVNNGYFVKVPFDLSHWQGVAEELYPDGLPRPQSNDPTQWLFEGHPAGSTNPLQVAVARLLGYRWPRQTGAEIRQCGPVVPDGLEPLADADGIVCLPAVAGEQPAEERLRALLAAAYGNEWSQSVQDRLLSDAGFAGKSLGEWLRDGFFPQHCKLFHNRPFVWHVWDGQKEGFSALVNYHGLDRAKLEKLIYTYLGTWIGVQQEVESRNEPGANARLVAAQSLKTRLEAILEGEPPYDIYIRWKPLHEQPIGWNPDLNDGVRLNIRPFVTAGVLRSKFTVNWNKDRGTNPDGSERINDKHFSRAEKEAAQGKKEGDGWN